MVKQKKPAVIEAEQSGEMLQHKKRAFLAAYRLCGSITKAAEISDIARKTHYEWMKDEDYQRAFADAHEEAGDYLEQEARRRAVDGVDEPVFYKGKKCGEVTKYSDTLLIFLLNGLKPEKYKQRTTTEHSGKVAHEHTFDPGTIDGISSVIARIAAKGIPPGAQQN